MKILLILKNWKRYKYLKAKRKGKKLVSYRRGAGYYLDIWMLDFDPSNVIWETKMRSGKVGVYQLIDYETYRDPDDMIKDSSWKFIGYKGMKPISECTFEEYISIYTNKK
ncbi:hypothetical protein [Elizabethkingia anophelis]|uniref:hypothetical protein n=1 Tax=Elizabethkingia anophelis TaxID=1117645 RepID=UPI000DD6079D|nr:hypothetical protein [Elizabethkingia anophelis]RBA36124.1 hypothetical protein DSC50_01895 [Elizabethkingia anophelis]